ncbi:phage tail length tape measure family protein [Azoarcus sp. DN11]|uniref:phage tail length tape measure family protein n=1 Tax=Azoarcus sp. DN11 TaxID=356837 RepID=UPI000EB41BC8|nr:phage tail length tape measure family protein [Azoarcus sp. DN11]AYH46095.1 hypothetical protein CDA09_22415 [Azoarcus sp. DN11]
MAARGDLTVALKLQADVAEAVKRLGDVESAIGRVEKAGDTAGRASAVNGLAQAATAAAQGAQTATAATKTWHDFVRERMGPLMRQFAQDSATHAEAHTRAIRQIGAEWKEYKAALASGTTQGAQAVRDVSQVTEGAAAAQQQLGHATVVVAQRMKGATITAGQYAQAMRQLPMQMTDVVTSLASGMPIWMVAIQQGGQIRDSFGGVGLALRALMGAINSATVGFAALAGTGVALAAAYNRAEEEARAYTLAVETTGNAAGATRGQIEALAAEAHRTSGISTGAAREIAVAMVQSGQLGIDTIGNLTQSVETYAAVTGQSNRQAAAALAAMFVKPAEAAEKLNRQFHFLSPEQEKYIRQLEEQGRTEEAQIELSRRLAERLDDLRDRSLQPLQRAWDSVGRAAAEAWDRFGSRFRDPTTEDQIAAQTKEVARLRAAASRDPNAHESMLLPSNARQLEKAEAELARLQTQQQAEQQKAADDRANTLRDQAREAADKSWERRNESLKNWRERLAEETAKIRAEGATLGKTQAEIDQQIARAAERLTPKGAKRTKVDPAETAFQSQLQSLTLARAEAEQRLKNAQEGVVESRDKATTRLEAWIGVNRNAQKLSDADIARLREQAAATDAAAKATDALTEAKKRDERIDSGMEQVNAELLEATGRGAEAAIAQVESRYRKLREDLTAAGNQGGLITLDLRINAEKAKVQLEELQRAIEKVFDGQGRGEQSIEAQVSAGLITELEGRERLVELHRQTAATVEGYLPALREMAALPGPMGEQARAALQTVETQLVHLRTTTDDLRNALRDGLQNGLQEALRGLADGTLTLRDALMTLVRGVAQSMADLATQRLAQQAANGLMSMFGGGEGETDMVTGAAAVTGSAAALAVAGGSLLTGAAAIEAAAASLAAAGAATGVAGLGFATGGYTGDGGKYEPAGVVHRGEFVTRKEVTQQPGALPFLHAFNELGMHALFGWRGYSDGGLVGAPAPALTAPRVSVTQLSESAAPSTTVKNAVNLHLYDDPQRIAEAAFRSKVGEENFVVMLSRDPARYRSILQL